MDAGPALVGYKLWRLRSGADLAEVTALSVERIAPHYRRLSTHVRLDLEDLGEGRVLAVQRWPSRAVRDAAMSGASFERWWADYQPLLRQWDAALDLVQEWEGEVLVRAGVTPAS